MSSEEKALRDAIEADRQTRLVKAYFARGRGNGGVVDQRDSRIPPGQILRQKHARGRNAATCIELPQGLDGGVECAAAGLGDLPLFAAAASAPEETADPVRERLRDLDVDALSPREALDVLYALKRAADDN